MIVLTADRLQHNCRWQRSAKELRGGVRGKVRNQVIDLTCVRSRSPAEIGQSDLDYPLVFVFFGFNGSTENVGISYYVKRLPIPFDDSS